MSQPLDYYPRRQPPGPDSIRFWVIFCTCGMASSAATAICFAPFALSVFGIGMIVLFLTAIVVDFALPLQRTLWQAAIPALCAPPAAAVVGVVIALIRNRT